MKFANRVALVTGAAGNIGQSVCQKLLENGVKVAATDLCSENVENLLASTFAQENKLIFSEMDVKDTKSVELTVDKTLENFGKIDILINNAGVWQRPEGKSNAFVDTEEEFWKNIIDINLCGVMRVTQVVLPSMLKNGYGRIINLSSIAGVCGLPGYCDYSAAKAGVIMFTKALAMEVAKKNITVNSVSPGMVSVFPDKTTETTGTWIGRTCTSAEVADLLLFLAKDDTGFITGVDYLIDGGRTIGPHNAKFE